MSVDVDSVRAQFPALSGQMFPVSAHFDGPGGTQTPASVAQAVAEAMTCPLSNRGRNTIAERNADDIVVAGRMSMAALLNADPGCIAFGRSATQITTDIARALSLDWGSGDEIVVSRLDHDANVRPWVTAARDRGATTRWIEFDRQTFEVDPEDVRKVVGPATRVVAITGASNLVGTMPDIQLIASIVHEVGALLYVDGVHLTPHALVDFSELDADLFVCSPYKFCGPHLGVLAGKSEVLASLRPYKLRPSSDNVPERFELGTLPYELLAGTSAAVDFLAGLVPPREDPIGPGTRPVGAGNSSDKQMRPRLQRSITGLIDHEETMFARLTDGLSALDGVRLLGSPSRRTPTAAFLVDRYSPSEVAAFLGERNVGVGGGHFYAIEAVEAAGVSDGVVRAGIAPYTNEADIDRLLDGLAALTV